MRTTNSLQNTATVQKVIYANQQPAFTTDLDDELAFYKDGILTSSPGLTYDGQTLETSGGLVVGYDGNNVQTGKQAKFGGWVNVRPNAQGSSYPEIGYNDGGFSMGWNLAGGAGEAVIMNNYDAAGQGVHFRMRKGATASNLLAAISETSPGIPMTGSLYTQNVRISGAETFLPGTTRSRDNYRVVYNGSLGPLGGPGNPSPAGNVLVLEKDGYGGRITAFAASLGDSNVWAQMTGVSYYAGVGGRSWGGVAATASANNLISLSTGGGTTGNSWGIYLRNSTATAIYWTVIWEEDSAWLS